MARLKAEGLVPGIPDLVAPIPRGKYHGFYAEMKNEGLSEKNLSPAQKQMIIYLTLKGYYAVCCAGVDKFKKEIDYYMGLI